jgi:hypothetical protein
MLGHVNITSTQDYTFVTLERNINFHQVPNKQLDSLIDKNNTFSNGEQAHLDKLDKILSQLHDIDSKPM